MVVDGPEPTNEEKMRVPPPPPWGLGVNNRYAKLFQTIIQPSTSSMNYQ